MRWRAARSGLDHEGAKSAKDTKREDREALRANGDCRSRRQGSLDSARRSSRPSRFASFANFASSWSNN
jgi:hypothetical protein